MDAAARMFPSMAPPAPPPAEATTMLTAAPVADTPPTEEQQAQWQQQSVKRLVERYGEDGAVSALNLARDLVKRDARVEKLLDHGQLGNHPKVVEMLVEKALRESTRGRLKKGGK